MSQPPDYRRRRAAVFALGALMLVSAGHHTPMIGTLSIAIDRDLVTRVDADWTSPVALALAAIAQVGAAIGTLFPR